MNKSIIAAIVVAVLSFNTNASNFDINKVMLGITETELKILFPETECRSSDITFERSCLVESSYGSSEAEYWFYFDECVLSYMQVLFNTSQYQRIHNLLEKKLGNPTSKDHYKILYLGTELENEVVTWKSDREVFRLMKVDEFRLDMKYVSPTERFKSVADLQSVEMFNEEMENLSNL